MQFIYIFLIAIIKLQFKLVLVIYVYFGHVTVAFSLHLPRQLNTDWIVEFGLLFVLGI